MTRTCRELECQREAVRYSPYCADHLNRHAVAAFASQETRPVWVRRLSRNAKELS